MADPEWTHRRMLEQNFAQFHRANPTFPVVISEGDSWFSFPGHYNIIDHLDEMLDHRISLLRLEDTGDTLMRMTSGAQRGRMRQLLTTYDVDVLLFSGGGNDVVGHEIRDLFREKQPHETWEDAKNESAITSQFEQIAAAYHALAELRDIYRPNCQIVTHAYDYVRPNGVPTIYWLWPIPIHLTFGPWIKSNLQLRNISDPADQQAVVRFLIDKFRDTLMGVAASRRNFTVIDSPGTLKKDSDWTDELHPSRRGFERLAVAFRDTLRKILPAKFPTPRAKPVKKRRG